MSITELLQLTIGLKPAIGDTASAENGGAVPNYQVIPLVLEGQITGFSLDNDRLWTPQIPTLKGGGSWADSVLFDGRVLQSEAVGNVTETIPLLAKGGTWEMTVSLIATLNRFIQNARRFTATRYQIQPVHIEWKAYGAPASQWAVVYNLDLAIDAQEATSPAYAKAVLTLEREPYWRAFPAGSNPKLWTFYKNGTTPTPTQLNLATTGNHLVEETIQNKHEWTPSGGNAYLTAITKNYIDIPAASIPGDVPALVEFSIGTTTSDVIWDLYVGRSSKKMRAVASDGTERADALTWNAGDARVVAGTKTSITKTSTGSAATGVLSNGSSVNFYRVDVVIPISGGYETTSAPIRWDDAGGTSFKRMDKQLSRGRYAIFIRGGQTNGAAGDTFLRFTYTEPQQTYGDPVVFTSQEVQTGFAGGVATMLHYMGEISIPFGGRAEVGSEGRGLEVLPANQFNATFGIDMRNANAAAARNVSIVDLIMIPIDECSILIQTPRTASATPIEPFIYDNTGYLTRAGVLDTAIYLGGTSDQLQAPLNLYSNPLTLLPGLDQRLFFIVTDISTTTPDAAQPDSTYTIRLNIIPRWSYVRDA